MKSLLVYIFFVLGICTLCSVTRVESCDVINKIGNAKIDFFLHEVKRGYGENQFILLNKSEYEEIFGEKMIETDSCYFFGKFEINKTRIGVYSYKTTHGANERNEIFELQIFDNCKKVGSHIIFADFDYPLYNNIECKFNKEFDKLTIIKHKSSEFVKVRGVDPDTLFTNTYKIDLKSKKLDTISKKSKFEVLKPPTQK